MSPRPTWDYYLIQMGDGLEGGKSILASTLFLQYLHGKIVRPGHRTREVLMAYFATLSLSLDVINQIKAIIVCVGKRPIFSKHHRTSLPQATPTATWNPSPYCYPSVELWNLPPVPITSTGQNSSQTTLLQPND